MRKITVGAIKALKVTGSRHTSRDQNIEIRVGANGSVAIDFYFKDKGRTGREKLLRLRSRDSVGAEEIADANERLAELRHDLVLGVTPIIASKKIKAASVRVTAAKVIERKNAPTVARLARDYEAIHLPTLKHDTRRNYSQMLRDYVIPSLGPELLAEVNRGLLVSLLDGEKRPATKAALRRLLGGLFTFAVERELIPASPAFKLTKVAPDVRSRQRILLPKEFKGFWASADNASRFLLATGQRVAEVAGMQWTDMSVPVDGNHGWLNRDPKLGQQVLIPLSDLAYSLLPQERDGD
ncbi:MAG: hypothetical protein GY813_07250, partial [Halieaceae bacterium]|nr:hypothetical protein [Halieaceae bacterium]